jgi:hypothetical protein
MIKANKMPLTWFFIALLCALHFAASDRVLSNCDGSSKAGIVPYNSYFESECTSYFHLEGHDCQSTDVWQPRDFDDHFFDNLHETVLEIGGFCDSYCQMKTTFTYGTEQPIDTQPLCRGPRPCKLGHFDERVGISFMPKHPVGAPQGYHDEILDVAVVIMS